MGDNAVYIKEGSGNTVEDNHPTPVEYEGGNVGKSDEGYFVNLTEDGVNPNPAPLPNDDDLAELTYNRTLAAPGSAEGSGDTQIDDKPANLFTICLPFAPKTDDAVKYYTLSGVSGETVNFDEVAERLGLNDLPAHEKAAEAEKDAKADARAEKRARRSNK